jgi:UDP-2,3-diacylglucosamine pyrophosphatase LpxH
MRALVISDTHFGAWTGEDLLREPDDLELLAPALDVDEVIFLGDMFDLMFASIRDSFEAARRLLELLRDTLQGKRFVFLAGNHDHHFVTRDAEDRLELALATGRSEPELSDELRRADLFRLFLEQHLEGVEVDIRYPTYTFAGVLCTHGHYLDLHASRSGGGSTRLLSRALWSIAVGGRERSPTIADYEATATLLTGLLYTIAQLPNGTDAQRRAFRTFQSLGHAVHLCASPVRAAEKLREWSVAHFSPPGSADRRTSDGAAPDGYRAARHQEMMRRHRTGAPAGGEASSYAFARSVAPSDPSARAVEAFEQAVVNLGWSSETGNIVFAHTHQPLDGVLGPGEKFRYWNTGSWIYEPDLRSSSAYVAYLRNAWPGTAVLIDSDEPEPRLLRLREHLNPLQEAANGR